MVFPWGLGDNKSPQVSRTLLTILVAQLPWWLIILLPRLIRPRAIQLAVKLAKIFEEKGKSVKLESFSE